MRIKPFGWFLIVALIAGLVYWGWSRGNNSQPATPLANTAAPAQGNLPSNGSQDSQGNPLNTPDVSTGVQGQTAVDGSYPVLCKPGTTLTQLTVAFDDYAGFYPLVYRIMALPASNYYCINLLPKWSGPNFDQNGFTESDMENKLRSGEVDIYFASNGALALWDANSGLVVYSTDQSSGADAILARNSVSSTGKPNFNDALGRIILTSKGSADHYYILKALQAVGFTDQDVTIKFTDSPVKDFGNGEGDFVTYWDPIIRDVMLPENTVITTTKDWRTISDYVVVSPQADANKQDALVYFLADYNIATEAFTVNNLKATADLLITFEFNGQQMADWLWMDPSDPYGSLNSLLDGVAIAKLNDNANMFERDGTGWSLVKDQFDKTHSTWQYGKVFDNADGTKGSLYNSSVFITDKYVKILVSGGAKNVAGDFNNPYITDINQNLPNVDNNTLMTLPELLTLKYKNIQFKEGEARTLVAGELEKLNSLVQPIANLMAESPESVIVLQGGHGYYSSDPAVMAQQARFAFRRAVYIREILSDPHGLNIPINRILIDPNIIAPDHTLSQEELPNYIVVIIKVVSTGGAK